MRIAPICQCIERDTASEAHDPFTQGTSHLSRLLDATNPVDLLQA
jgi:hypothetical protein